MVLASTTSTAAAAAAAAAEDHAGRTDAPRTTELLNNAYK